MGQFDDLIPAQSGIFDDLIPKSVKQASFVQPEFKGQYPNTYAALKTASDMIPYAEYLDPDERDAFMKLSTQEQTNKLLKNTLDAELLVAFPKLIEGVGNVVAPTMERFFPKTYKFWTKERGVKTPEVKPTEVKPETPVETKPIGEVQQTGTFDDLIPKETPIQQTRGTFDDLIPKKIKAEPVTPIEQNVDYLKENKSAQEFNPEPIKPEIKPETPIEGTPAKAALDINKSLAEKGFDELPPEELATYNPITKVETIQKVSDFMTADKEKAYQIAKGNEPAPNDIHPQVLFNAVKNEATKAGDVETLIDLAKSPIAEERSVAAQKLGASGFNNVADDVVSKIREVYKARETKIVNPKVVERVKTQLKEAVNKVNLTKEELSWDRFLEKIVC